MLIKRCYLHTSWGGPLYAIFWVIKHDKGVNSVGNNDRLKRVQLEWRDKHPLTKKVHKKRSMSRLFAKTFEK